MNFLLKSDRNWTINRLKPVQRKTIWRKGEKSTMLRNTKGGQSKLLQALNRPSRRPAQGSKQSSFLSMQKDTFVNFHHFFSARKHPKGGRRKRLESHLSPTGNSKTYLAPQKFSPKKNKKLTKLFRWIPLCSENVAFLVRTEEGFDKNKLEERSHEKNWNPRHSASQTSKNSKWQ